MTESRVLTPEQKDARRRLAQVGWWFGAALFLFGIVLVVLLGQDVMEIAGGAEELTISEVVAMAEADERIYARLVDAEWQCETINYVEGLSASQIRQLYVNNTPRTRYTQVIATDGGRNTALLVTLSGAVACGDLTYLPEGFIYLDDDLPVNNAPTRNYLNRANVTFRMCGYCGLANSSMGLIGGGLFMLLGLVFIFVGRVMRAQA